MSAQALADACEELGHPIPRNVIANLESGRRSGLTLADVLVLGKALDIPPLWLLFPLDHAARVKALPMESMDTWRAFTWFTGEKDRRYARALDAFRLHERAHDVLLNAWYRYWQADAERAPGTAEAPESAWRSEERTARAVEDLRRARTLMRLRGLALPHLPPQLSFVDEETPPSDNAQEGTT